MGDNLRKNYELIAEGFPLAHYNDVPLLYRNFGLWMTSSGLKHIDENRVAALVAWRRNKKES